MYLLYDDTRNKIGCDPDKSWSSYLAYEYVVLWEMPIDDKNDDSLPLIYAKVMKLVNMVVSKTTDI